MGRTTKPVDVHPIPGNSVSSNKYVKGKVYEFNGLYKKFDGRQMRRLCSTTNCFKLAVGKKMKCKGHGGGRRCTFVGCLNSAVDKGLCKRHGGGKRCLFPSCSKSAVGSTTLCKLHGGGKRCSFENCRNSAVSRSLCIRHGGGPRCQKPGCSKGARSPHQFCYAHGGGRRCSVPTCSKPANRTGLCNKCNRATATVETAKPLPSVAGGLHQHPMYQAHHARLGMNETSEPLAKRSKPSPELMNQTSYSHQYAPPMLVPTQGYPYTFAVPFAKPQFVQQHPVPNYPHFGALPGESMFVAQPHLSFRI